MRPMAIIRRILGTTCFLLGIVAILLPVIPGFVLMGIGLYILSIDSPGLQARLAAVRERSPALDRFILFFERKFRRQKDESDAPDRRDTLQP